VWNVVTAGFVELHLLSVRARVAHVRTGVCLPLHSHARAHAPAQALFNAAALLLVLRLVEPRWGGAETLRFALIANAGAGVATFVILFLVYVFTRNDHVLYAQVAGGQALVAALLVAVKQLLPEQELVFAGVSAARLRGKHAASAFLAAFACVCGVRGDAATALHAAAGAAAGWVYLRHYQARTHWRALRRGAALRRCGAFSEVRSVPQ
jgi:hypothetical protein